MTDLSPFLQEEEYQLENFGPDRIFKYNELDIDEPVSITAREIFETYYQWWYFKVKKVRGKSYPCNFERCVEDWCIVHWAWEYKQLAVVK